MCREIDKLFQCFSSATPSESVNDVIAAALMKAKTIKLDNVERITHIHIRIHILFISNSD